MPSRYLSAADREALFIRSGERCERCSEPITLESMHAAHLRAHVHGGPAVLSNLGAWCARCNLQQGSHDVCDPRPPARDWQLEALGPILYRLMAANDAARVATLSAAPGAGKTYFAGLVFLRLFELGLVDRMLVLVPRKPLVKQWIGAMLNDLHIELKGNSAVERSKSGQAGVVVTYQSLNPETVSNHANRILELRTLLVLDEVHHLSDKVDEDTGEPAAWGKWVTQLAGTVDKELKVAAILNLSGTLWRTTPNERISTVRYEPDEEKPSELCSVVDYSIESQRLILDVDPSLRPVDLWRMGARVTLDDFMQATTIDSHITDLHDRAGRAVLRGVNLDAAWRTSFIEVVLDKLRDQRDSLPGVHVKALIVATSRQQAQLLQQTANAITGKHTAVLATSKLPNASEILEEFRQRKGPGILCTCDMAGEGFDCPEICVLGFATNKLTKLYIRQVVARAQRLTTYERTHKAVVPAMIVAPDVPELIKRLGELLAPMRHTIEDLPLPLPPRPPRPPRPDDDEEKFWPPPMPTIAVTGVTPDADTTASISEDTTTGVPGEHVQRVAKHLLSLAAQPSIALRSIIANQRAHEEAKDVSPLDPIDPALRRDYSDIFGAVEHEPPSKRAMSVEEQAQRYRNRLKHASGWWQMNRREDNCSVQTFTVEMHKAAGIRSGERETASLDQLRAAWGAAWQFILRHCGANNLRPPNPQDWDR